jgi:DNA-binding response OmpR family regulator
MTKLDCILLLEPEIIARQPLAEFLRDCGFKVVEAATVPEARALLEAEALEVDAVLADAGNNAGAVFALARWIRLTFPAVPVILAGTIDKTAEEVGDLCKDGPALVKPYDHQGVLQHIKRLLASRRSK